MELLFLCRFLIMADQPALVDTLPVLGKELPIRTLFHGGVVLFATDKAFHQARLLIDKFCGVLFLCHRPVCCRGIRYRYGSGTTVPGDRRG
jgi:hypothetical protein